MSGVAIDKLRLDDPDDNEPALGLIKVEHVLSDVDSTSQKEDGASGARKKKKKKKKKRKPKDRSANPLLNPFPDQAPEPSPESPEVKIERDAELVAIQARVTPNAMLILDYPKADLDLLWTPSCRSLELLTPRLRLRQCGREDLKMIQKIKTEPTVNKTQLYGQPHLSWIKPSFLGRYIRSSMPRIEVKEDNGWRTDFVFAITLRDPQKIEIGPPGRVLLRNRLLEGDKAGYVGNFGLELNIHKPSPEGMRRKGKVATHPTFAEMDFAEVKASMYYELHPQLWGQGLVSEAFIEVLRFAFEELGCPIVQADPTKGNEASIKLCEKNGLKFTHLTSDNPYNKPQLVHEITRDQWFKLNRGTKPVDRWGGKAICRWCMNPRLAPPTIVCQYCSWAKYCSRECQKADWVYGHGHQEQCAGRSL